MEQCDHSYFHADNQVRFGGLNQYYLPPRFVFGWSVERLGDLSGKSVGGSNEDRVKHIREEPVMPVNE